MRKNHITVIVKSSEHMKEAPLWAVLQRKLIDVINGTPEIILDRYVRPNGYMLWPQDSGNFQCIDGLDDMYESFHNWPLFYLIGGDKKFLRYSHRQFNAITEQFSGIGTGYGHPMVVNEYESGYDWMHQGEGYLFFYLLNLADPKNPANIERSKRFAGFYLNEGADNYDCDRRLMKCCYVGSMGAGRRIFDKAPWKWAEWKQWYGLPYNDIPGIITIDDIKDDNNARAMSSAIHDRLKSGDSVANLAATSMVLNAFMHAGDMKYRDWILGYINAWREQTVKNGGILPDNRGPGGEFGECLNGKWYGGYYGWTWPHGFGSIASPLTIACENEALLTTDPGKMDWLRSQFELLRSKAVLHDNTLHFPHKHSDPGAVQEYFTGGGRTLTVPDKVTRNPALSRLLEKDGWYEYIPLSPEAPVHAWFVGRTQKDTAFLHEIRDHKTKSWETINKNYSKYQGGQDAMWSNYIDGGLPGYPEAVMEHNLNQVYARLALISEDAEPPEQYSDSYLQRRNPVNAEGLVQLTMGGPYPIYNGGLMQVSVCYFDVIKKRIGLPCDVAALVSEIRADRIRLTLMNLHPGQSRQMIVQAGAFGEHHFVKAVSGAGETQINGRHFQVVLSPAGRIIMDLYMERYRYQPAYQWPV